LVKKNKGDEKIKGTEDINFKLRGRCNKGDGGYKFPIKGTNKAIKGTEDINFEDIKIIPPSPLFLY
jgi:hypothetical protein